MQVAIRFSPSTVPVCFEEVTEKTIRNDPLDRFYGLHGFTRPIGSSCRKNNQRGKDREWGAKQLAAKETDVRREMIVSLRKC